MWLRRLVTALLVLLLLPAATLTWARLLEPRGRLGVVLVAFAPYAVPLYALAVLVLLLVWWRAGGRARTLAKTLTALGALALALHLAWARGPYVGPGTAGADGARLRVMTANLRLGGADPARVVQAAVAHRVDVLVLEEVTPQALGGMRAAGLRLAFAHRAGSAADGAAGTMVFSKRPLSRVRRVRTGFGGYAMRVRTGREPVTLLAVHARPPLGGTADWAEDLNAVRAAAVDRSGPVMIVGDLNATTDHLPLRDLAGRGFDDAATQARSGWQPTWPSATRVPVLGLPVPTMLPIDHVLVNDGLRAVRTRSLPLPGSDHRALLAILAT
jgi:endonuclease/exonuclease/phosphatase (EEP) superfamily protein YafD